MLDIGNLIGQQISCKKVLKKRLVIVTSPEKQRSLLKHEATALFQQYQDQSKSRLGHGGLPEIEVRGNVTFISWGCLQVCKITVLNIVPLLLLSKNLFSSS